MSIIDKRATELLIENGVLVADTLRHLADNEIDSDYFAICHTNENGTEIECELAITDYARQAAGTVDELVKALEAAEKRIAELEMRTMALRGKPMSTITKELAKLFRKITNSEIDAEGNAHVVLSPADSLLINNARIALASLEAEPVAWAHRLINKRNGVVHPWVYGSAEACPSEGDIFNIEVMPLYTVPPAPVSVPDAMEMDDDFDSSFEHGKAVGWNAYRAAMLQGADGNSPVIPDGWVACSERMPEGMTDVHISNGHDIGQGWWDGDTWQTQHDYYSVPGDVTHWMPLPNPPKE